MGLVPVIPRASMQMRFHRCHDVRTAHQNDNAGVVAGAESARLKIDGKGTLGLLPVGIPAKRRAKPYPAKPLQPKLCR